MQTARLSSTGQVIIPKTVRDTHHWASGTEFTIEEQDGGILLRPRKPFPPTRLEEGIGCAGYRGPALSVEEMDAAHASSAR